MSRLLSNFGAWWCSRCDTGNSAPTGGSAPVGAPPHDVTRILIHGVGGSTPEKLLRDSWPQQVAGDRVAGFYRKSKGAADQPPVAAPTVEAYAWGGLTSRSRTRVLWVLLLPFMLANMAGWMAEPKSPAKARTTDPPTTVYFRWVTRLAGIAMTIAAVLMFSLLGMDVIGYQCGATPSCVDNAGGWRPWGGSGPRAIPHAGS